ncbi:hypothetical protein Leryth_004251 [Lithospermum erythrorhizon]|nr:hypothetical protein Leryth_004251 [Lithospermum erythrorhizon]
MFINSLILLISIVSLFIICRLFIYRTALIYVLRRWFRFIDEKIHAHQIFKVPEVNENGQQNHLFKKVQVYVNSLASVEDSDFTNLFSGENSSTDIILSLDDNQVVPDKFLGAKVSWVNGRENNGQRCFLLKMKRKDKRRILKPYLQHILTVVEGMNNKELKLFINNLTQSDQNIGRWRSFPFRHPSTMETMIMDVDLKNKVKSDLEMFIKLKQHYHKLGRIWKRNYLLYGPSGTGKSSFIAAMANFLKYDVYDVDLNRIKDDSDLKMLMVQINSKSLVVIEDLDRFICKKSSSLMSGSGVSLSGLLNFMDGMNNGDGKIMVFTMNNKDEIDPMVLRPGRIDVHIYFPLCDFSSFKSLAHSYLGVREHKLFPHVEEIIQSGAMISPAEISELMVANRNSPSRALKSVITALQLNLNGGGRVERRLSDSVASSPAISYTEENGIGGWKEGVPGLKKLYGMLKSKSSNKIGVFDCASSPMMER